MTFVNWDMSCATNQVISATMVASQLDTHRCLTPSVALICTEMSCLVAGQQLLVHDVRRDLFFTAMFSARHGRQQIEPERSTISARMVPVKRSCLLKPPRRSDFGSAWAAWVLSCSDVDVCGRSDVGDCRRLRLTQGYVCGLIFTGTCTCKTTWRSKEELGVSAVERQCRGATWAASRRREDCAEEALSHSVPERRRWGPRGC